MKLALGIFAGVLLGAVLVKVWHRVRPFSPVPQPIDPHAGIKH